MKCSLILDLRLLIQFIQKCEAFRKESGFNSKKYSFKHFEGKDHNGEKIHFSIEIKVWPLFGFSIMPCVALNFACFVNHFICLSDILCHFFLSVFHNLECSLAILFFLYSADTCSKRLAQI